MAEESIPQWKRELIERRRALGRAASVGPLQFTCPGVVSAVRQPDLSQGMRLPSAVPDIQQLLSQIEASTKGKMGEEKTKKHSASTEKVQTKNGDSGNLSDSSEELKYGPGIVSKLKNKYLSLTLRETNKVRPSLANLRRATSLENILDEPDNVQEIKIPVFTQNDVLSNGGNIQARRGLSRSKESMKRARSVEALVRYSRKLEKCEDSLAIENQCDVSKNRLSLEEKELPPPDTVKLAKKRFESVNTPPTPPPLVKIPSVSKNLTSVKPIISPKPPALEKSAKPRIQPFLNGNSDAIKISDKPNEVKLSHKLDLHVSAPVVPGARPIKEIIPSPSIEPVKVVPHSPKKGDVLLTASSVKIIENIPCVKTVNVEQTVISSKQPEKPSDFGEGAKPKPVYKKDWTQVITERTSVIKDRKVPSSPEPPTPKERSSFFLEQTVSRKDDSTPSPKPRMAPKIGERRQMEPTSPIYDPMRSPVRTPEFSPTPTSQMKQVGVIRPIVTQKSPQQSPNQYPTSKVLSKTLSDRELEKNLLNKVKSVEQPVTKVIVSLKKSPEDCTVSATKDDKVVAPKSWSSKPNTMVFNFSDRKDVPDYIENDGLILTSRKERPKVGDSGIIILQGATDDSSTDLELDDSVVDLPSPCDIVFIGDNVLINGKSSLQKNPKRTKLRIKFNEEAPTLYEYPSEASLLEETTLDHTEPTSPGLNLPLRSTSLASYTPSKVNVNTDFQLGVTRTPQPPPPKTADANSSDEEDYLRPADESTTVAWSADCTDTADLLY